MATRTAMYKGRKYVVKFLGNTKFGVRAKLAFFDGSREFWVPAGAVSGDTGGGFPPRSRRGGSSLPPTPVAKPYIAPRPEEYTPEHWQQLADGDFRAEYPDEPLNPDWDGGDLPTRDAETYSPDFEEWARIEERLNAASGWAAGGRVQ